MGIRTEFFRRTLQARIFKADFFLLAWWGHETYIPHQRGGAAPVKDITGMVLCPSLCNSTPCFVYFQNLQKTTVRRSHSRRALTSCPCMDESNCKSPHSSCCQKAMPAWGDFCVAHLSSVTAAPLLTKLQFLVFQKNHRPHRSSEGWKNYEGGSFFFCWGVVFFLFFGVFGFVCLFVFFRETVIPMQWLRILVKLWCCRGQVLDTAAFQPVWEAETECQLGKTPLLHRQGQLRVRLKGKVPTQSFYVSCNRQPIHIKSLRNEAHAFTSSSCQHISWVTLTRCRKKNPSRWAPTGEGVSKNLGKIGSQLEEISQNYHSSETGRQSSTDQLVHM